MVRILVVLLVCTVPAANAEIIEFDMTGLTGSSTDSVKVDSLVYNGPLVVVNSVSIRVTGLVEDLGEICCGGPEVCTGETYPWIMTWWGNVRKSGDASGGKYVASCSDYLDQEIPFDQIGLAENQNGFATLTDGDNLDVVLYFGRIAWIGECDLIRPPSGTMYTVKVTMNVTSTLPTQSVTWGRVKTLFN